jgi:hypothetical protein
MDLNRNSGYMWGGPGSSGTTSSGIYRGPSPFSEPETQAIRDLVLSYDFRFLMDYHSTGQMIYSPGEPHSVSKVDISDIDTYVICCPYISPAVREGDAT